jgi:hypothetical protein
MTFNLPTLLVLAAVGASVLILLQSRSRLFAIFAVGASVIELLYVLKILTFAINGLSIWLILGGVLVVAGIFVWLRNGHKAVITAATVLILVGGIQVFTAVVR